MPEIFYNNEGYFLIRFESKEDKNTVLVRGPYMIYRKPMFLHEWTPEFKLEEDMLRVLPIWVIFPNLPLAFWGETSLGKIASAIGKPLMTDECTAKKLRVSYARVLIEVDVTKVLKKSVAIRDPKGIKTNQDVEYEWEPAYCKKCDKVGHICKEKEPPIQQKVWIVKPTKQDEPIPLQPETKTSPETWQTVFKYLRQYHSMLAWNIMGLNKRARHVEIGAHLKRLQINCAALLETRVKKNKADEIRKRFGNKWNWLDNYSDHSNGRIWIMWEEGTMQIIPIQKTDQYIHFDVLDMQGSRVHILTVIYAQNQLMQRRKLWDDIKQVAGNIHDPWLVVGDYNNVLHPNDRIGGHPVQASEVKDLKHMMEVAGLFEHGTTGWNIQEYGWPMHILWKKLKNVQSNMREMNKQVMDQVNDIKELRLRLEQAQEKLSTDRFNEGKIEEVQELTNKLLKATETEEQILHQKAKINWMRYGDGNTAYFHATIRGKNKQTGLYHLEDAQGRKLTEHSDIENEVIRFYDNLIGKTAPKMRHVDITVLRQGAQLEDPDRAMLIQPVTDKEIWEALSGIGDTKAPGIDGFSARFFKGAWTVVGEDVKKAVQDFFKHERLYPAVNCALVTLIPKKKDAKTMKEMRPIACCTTIYKIISKILTARMRKEKSFMTILSLPKSCCVVLEQDLF
ncbi:uncharacterized protein LOC131642116 [Vicia villosa]|uniref:uncharacterized protein LOC131642116 n=1 Tax=Vicia villosa TaxID=3911 RepID=UPI00273B3775|nr:uncharacterized protein LOC131642116 [Vicia villosa]